MDTHRCAGGLGIQLLNPSNYKVWRTCMESYLVGEGLWDVVDGNDVQIPEEAAAGSSDAISKWKQLNGKAEFALKKSISIGLFGAIMGCKSAHEIWRTLDGLFREGSDHDQSADSGDKNHVRLSRDLYDATVKGDWKAAESIFKEDPNALSERITLKGETALHVAINFGHDEFVEKLVALMPEESLEKHEHVWGCTALHYAVVSGNLSMVKTLVNRHVKLIQLVDIFQQTPLLYGPYTLHGKSKEILWYLTLKIPHEIQFTTNPFFSGSSGGNLMKSLVASRCYDICLHLLERYPFLSIAKGKNANGMLPALICHPFDFQSGSKLSFWERCIYQFIPIESYHKQQHSFSRSDMEDPRAQPPSTLLQSMIAFLRQGLQLLA